jgi:hypothetical protein
MMLAAMGIKPRVMSTSSRVRPGTVGCILTVGRSITDDCRRVSGEDRLLSEDARLEMAGRRSRE